MSYCSNGKNNQSHQLSFLETLAQIGLLEVRRIFQPSRATLLVRRDSAYLDLAQLSGAFHPAGHVHRVAPDIVLRLPGSNHAGDHRPVVNTWPDRGTRTVRKPTSVNR